VVPGAIGAVAARATRRSKRLSPAREARRPQPAQATSLSVRSTTISSTWRFSVPVLTRRASTTTMRTSVARRCRRCAKSDQPIGLRVASLEIDDVQVRALPHFDRSDLRSRNPGRAPRRGWRARAPGHRSDFGPRRGFLNEGGGPHFPQRRSKPIVARRRRRPPMLRDIPPPTSLGIGRDAAARAIRLELGQWTTFGLLARESLDASPSTQTQCASAARGPEMPTESRYATRRFPSPVSPSAARAVLGAVRMDDRAGSLGPSRSGAQRRTRVNWHESAARKAVAQATVRPPCHLAHRSALSWRRDRVTRAATRDRLRVHQTLPAVARMPMDSERLERSPGVTYRFHVEDRRRATKQQLRRASIADQ